MRLHVVIYISVCGYLYISILVGHKTS